MYRYLYLHMNTTCMQAFNHLYCMCTCDVGPVKKVHVLVTQVLCVDFDLRGVRG